MAGLPLVSIVTPAFNAVSTIRETLDSVRLQDYPYIEHIVVDGGSNDGTLDILRSYDDIRWVSERDDGQSDAINKGFADAHGQIYAWLNADDTYEPGAVRTAVEHFQAFPQSDLVYSDCHLVDGKGQRIGRAICDDYTWQCLLDRTIIPQQTVFMRRHVWESVGGLNPQMHYFMDHDLWLRVALRGFRIVRIPGIWANYRLVAGTKTVDQPSCFWLERVPRIEQLLEEDSFSNKTTKAKIRSRLYFKAGIAFLLAEQNDHAISSFEVAFANGQLPYADIQQLAEEIVGYSLGPLGNAGFCQRRHFINTFLRVMPAVPFKRELEDRLAIILTFEAAHLHKYATVRELGTQVLINSAIARSNRGLFKVTFGAWIISASNVVSQVTNRWSSWCQE